MIYVHEFVDELDCERCPHNAPADEESGWGDFDFVCLARDDEFIFPEGCPAYLGPWGAWRAGVGDMVWYCLEMDRLNRWGDVALFMRVYVAIRNCWARRLGAVGWSP